MSRKPILSRKALGWSLVALAISATGFYFYEETGQAWLAERLNAIIPATNHLKLARGESVGRPQSLNLAPSSRHERLMEAPKKGSLSRPQLPRLTAVLSRHERSMKAHKEVNHTHAWLELLKLPADAKEIFVNSTPYVSDMKNYGVKDFWASPHEFFAYGGDCDDYAIAKYIFLRHLGFPAEDLRIVFVLTGKRHQLHSVLIVRLKGNEYVLDNLIDTVRPITQIETLQQLVSFNEDGYRIRVRKIGANNP